MQLHFADDSQEQPVEIYHKLKLYDEADPNNPSTKKPVRRASQQHDQTGLVNHSQDVFRVQL